MPSSVRLFAHRLLVAAAALLLVSCSVTRRVPEGELLLDRVEFQGDLGGQTDLMSYVRQQPNTRFLGLWRLGLCTYSIPPDPPRTGFGRWLQRIGSQPVTYDSTAAARSSEQIRLYLSTCGFLDATVSDSLIRTRPKRCEVVYRVQAGQVYRISNLTYEVPDGEVGQLVMVDSVNALIHNGDPFDEHVFDQERERITLRLRENGFYSFGKDYVYFRYKTDSLSPDGHDMKTTMVVSNAMGGRDKRTPVPHRKAVIDSLTFVLRTPTQKLDNQQDNQAANPAANQAPDAMPGQTLKVDSAIVARYDADKSPFTRRFLGSSSFVTPGEVFRLSDGELMRGRLSSLSAIRMAEVRYSEVDTLAADSLIHLRCLTTVETAPRHTFGFDVEGTNSSGNLGAAFNVRYTHANVFRGAEGLGIKGRLATQHQSAVGGKDDFYTLEMGIETSLTYPFLMFPTSSLHFYKKHNPRTLFSISYDYQRRPEFTRNVFATRMTYTWRGTAYATHSLTPIEFNVVRIPSIDGNFANYINGTYLEYSYMDHFIMSLGYQFTFNQQTVQRNQSGIFLRVGVETAGNVLDLCTKNQTPGEDFKKIWNIRFAQYVKGDVELRFQSADLWGNVYAARLFAGAGLPYGNSVMLPYEKSYFVGGANSIRAWPVRGLGPGAQKADPSLRYHNQTGDIRLEANAEYRFKIISVLEGAAFADAGNIWMLNKEHNAAESVFTKDFYKQIALGAGLGLRLNFSYFVIRVDAAYKLHDPAADGNKWVVRRHFDSDEINWNFAIGYPF